MLNYRKGNGLVVLGLLLGLGTTVAGAVGFFEEERELSRTQDRYEVPNWDGVEWMPTLPTEAALVGGGAPEVLLAAASNFYADGEGRMPKYVRAMALVLAHQMSPDAKPIRMANYQLRYRRQPERVPGWDDRQALAAKLWGLAWQAHKTEAGHGTAGFLLLDLAAAFDPDNELSMPRYRELSGGQMELRWAGAVRLPEGVDAPDYVAEERGDPEIELVTADTPSPEAKEPAEFAFILDRASILIPATSEAGQQFIRLRARTMWVDPALAAKRRKQAERGKGKGEEAYQSEGPLPVGFEIGQHNGSQAPLVIAELRRARVEFIRRRAGAVIPDDLGVGFDIEGGFAPASSKLLSVAAGVLLESMASGVVLEPESAAAGLLGFGSTLQPSPALGSALMGSVVGGSPAAGASAVKWPRLAVPVFSEDAFADMAALGEYGLLMGVQVIGCRKIDDAVGALAAAPDEPTAKAIELFADITRAAERTPPHLLMANAKVRERLAEVVALCPEHLSAAHLLRAATRSSSATASLQGSVERLRLVDHEVRDWVLTHLGSPGGSAARDERGDERCAEALATLRGLRPRIHPKARQYADGLTGLIDDLRVSLRSQHRGSGGSGVASRRAEALRSALDSLEIEVVTLGVEEP